MAVCECVGCAWEQWTSPLSMPSGFAVWTLGVAQNECHHMWLHICNFSMDVKLEHRANINSAWNSANLERRLLKWQDVHMEMRPWVMRGVLSGTRASRGRTSLEDNGRSGQTSTSSAPKNVETIPWLVHEDRWRTIKDIAAFVNVS